MTGPELLREYLADEGITPREFSRAYGLNEGGLSMWLRGLTTPSGGMAIVIQSATGGAVPFAAWYEAAPKPKRKRGRK